jgi:hypothetical protein
MAAAALLLNSTPIIAGTAVYEFSTDPTTDPDLLIVGNNPEPWQPSGGNPGGFLALTYPEGSQYTGMLFPDIDPGRIVTAFKFECDLRVGNPRAQVRPADGFSISFARSNDPLLTDLANTGNFAGGVPEAGSTTGIAISFDTWQGNALPDGPDIEGIIVRVDNRTILRHSMPTRNGACEDVTSLQTGPRNVEYWDAGGDPREPGSWESLCWQPFSVELKEDGKLTVIYKGNVLLDDYQTDYFPSPGRLILAGRTGGADQNNHLDNIRLTTTAIVPDTSPPTVPGNLRAATTGASLVALEWDASTDDSGRVAYRIERDGEEFSSLVSGTTYVDTGLKPNTSYTYRIRAVDPSGNHSDWSPSLQLTTAGLVETEGVLMGRIYDGIPGVALDALLWSDKWPDDFDRTVFLNGISFGEPNFGNTFGDNFGIAIAGVLRVPESGSYRFFVRSDDASGFYLNTEGPEIPDPWAIWAIAEETGCCQIFQEPPNDRTSEPVSLSAGQAYGFLFLVKEGGGGDWGQVAMRREGDTTPAAQLQPIRGSLVTGMSDPHGTPPFITSFPGSQFVSVGQTATLTATTAGSEPISLQWLFNDQEIAGATSATLTVPNVTLSQAGRYTLRASNIAGTSTADVSITLRFTEGLPPIEQGPDGLVVTEAEHWDNNVSQGGHDWIYTTSNSGFTGTFSGTGYMRAVPAIGANRATYPDFLTQSPRLDYQVNFNRAGTHYVWLRGLATDGGDDSLHAGINGDNPATARRIDGPPDAGWQPFNTWSWGGNTQDEVDGSRRTRIEVPSAGVHTFNVWMREDGFRLDKIILTPDANYTPEGMGPEDTRVTGDPGPIEGPRFTGIARDGNNIVIQWEGGGTLQSVETITGIWQDVAGAAGGSYSAPPTGAQRYYRLRQ